MNQKKRWILSLYLIRLPQCEIPRQMRDYLHVDGDEVVHVFVDCGTRALVFDTRKNGLLFDEPTVSEQMEALDLKRTDKTITFFKAILDTSGQNTRCVVKSGDYIFC
jgi:hypothetical protein